MRALFALLLLAASRHLARLRRLGARLAATLAATEVPRPMRPYWHHPYYARFGYQRPYLYYRQLRSFGYAGYMSRPFSGGFDGGCGGAIYYTYYPAYVTVAPLYSRLSVVLSLDDMTSIKTDRDGLPRARTEPVGSRFSDTRWPGIGVARRETLELLAPHPASRARESSWSTAEGTVQPRAVAQAQYVDELSQDIVQRFVALIRRDFGSQELRPDLHGEDLPGRHTRTEVHRSCAGAPLRPRSRTEAPPRPRPPPRTVRRTRREEVPSGPSTSC
jgi:hypothetical protein